MGYYRKAPCMQCAHYASCPTWVRAFVNYCGSTSALFGSMLAQAERACRAQRGLMLYHRGGTARAEALYQDHVIGTAKRIEPESTQT